MRQPVREGGYDGRKDEQKVDKEWKIWTQCGPRLCQPHKRVIFINTSPRLFHE